MEFLTFFDPEAVTPARLIYLAILIGVILLCVLPGKIKKHKIELLNQENPEAKKDADKMAINTCPICGNKYIRIDKSRSVMDCGARLINGTYYAPEYSNRNDFELKCDCCNYSVVYTQSRYVDRDNYDSSGNPKVTYSYSKELSFTYKTTEEVKARLTKAMEYQRKKDSIENK